MIYTQIELESKDKDKEAKALLLDLQQSAERFGKKMKGFNSVQALRKIRYKK